MPEYEPGPDQVAGHFPAPEFEAVLAFALSFA
jgi:hypothetical protein